MIRVTALICLLAALAGAFPGKAVADATSAMATGTAGGATGSTTSTSANSQVNSPLLSTTPVQLPPLVPPPYTPGALVSPPPGMPAPPVTPPPLTTIQQAAPTNWIQQQITGDPSAGGQLDIGIYDPQGGSGGIGNTIFSPFSDLTSPFTDLNSVSAAPQGQNDLTSAVPPTNRNGPPVVGIALKTPSSTYWNNAAAQTPAPNSMTASVEPGVATVYVGGADISAAEPGVGGTPYLVAQNNYLMPFGRFWVVALIVSLLVMINVTILWGMRTVRDWSRDRNSVEEEMDREASFEGY